ncbi:SemiSWEET family transporter [Oenococcus oeni]
MKINHRISTVKDKERISTKKLTLISRLAICTCCLMYISYIPQIILNLSGKPVSPLQPAAATINAVLWVSYGWLKSYKDWPLIISNIPGVAFGLVTLFTVYFN